MVASNNSGGFRPTADVQRALADAGFAFRAPEINWNAPANHPIQARNENAQREAEERQKAQEAIENNVTNIRSALANPNIDQATRAKLEADLGKLEGLRTQLDGGRATAAQVSASVASITSSVSATVASVSAGGAMGAMSAGQMAAFQQSYGLQSLSSATTPEQLNQVYASNMQKLMPRVENTMNQLRSRGLTMTSDEEKERDALKARAFGNPPDAHAAIALADMQTRIRERNIAEGRIRADDPAVIEQKKQDDYMRAQAQQKLLLEQQMLQAQGQGMSAEEMQRRQTQNDQRISSIRQDNNLLDRRTSLEGNVTRTQTVERGVANQTDAAADSRDVLNKTRAQQDVARTETPQNQQVADGADAPAQPNHTLLTTTSTRGLFGARATPAATAQGTQTLVQATAASTATEQKLAEAPQVAASEQTKEAAVEAARPAAQAQVKPDGEASKTEAAKPTQVAAAAPATQSAVAARA